MIRKTVADLVVLRAALSEKRRASAYRATEGHNEARIAEMVKAHEAIVALDAVIAERGEGMDVDTFEDTLAAFGDLNK